ncbi:MAG: protoheme IX farnesyltransferase [Candidatus Kapaibacteriales bacterium]
MELSKLRIGAAITVTAAFGYMLAAGTVDAGMIVPLLGTLILATGASALNQYQEHEYDAMMARTADRPIPKGELQPNIALYLSIAIILVGLWVLSLCESEWPVVLGMANVVWYNIIYTPLKRKSAWAVVPGSVVGALPPMIGFAAAGGDVFQMDILYFAMFIFVWQIPHFWILLLKYDKEYVRAGYPVLTEKLSKEQLLSMIFAWTMTLAGLALIMPMFGLGTSIVVFSINLLLTVWIIRKSIVEYKKGLEEFNGKGMFLSLNIYVMCLLLVVALERVFFILI